MCLRIVNIVAFVVPRAIIFMTKQRSVDRVEGQGLGVSARVLVVRSWIVLGDL